MLQSIPIILCSKTAEIGAVVMAGLKPEYEVIYHIQSVTDGEKFLPTILKGQEPAGTLEENIGSKNFANVPVAVVVGGGFSNAEFDQVRGFCNGLSKVSWLRTDLTKPMPPMGPEYGLALAKRLKATLGELHGKGETEKDEVYWF